MLRRIRSALGERFAPKNSTGEHHPPSAEAVSTARRGFFAKATVGAVALSGTAGLAKVVGDSVARPDLQDLYKKDHFTGEQELSEREYVLMSDDEKNDMVQQLVDNYEKG